MREALKPYYERLCWFGCAFREDVATVLDQDGRVVAQRRMINELVLSFLRLFNVEKVGLEASTYVAPLYRALVKEGYKVEVSHPKKTRYIAKARIKSDRVDSKAIAELVRLDVLPRSYMPPPEIAELREKIRHRTFLVRERAKLMTKIRGVLAYEGLKPPDAYGLFTRKGVEWLHSLNLEPIECYLRILEVLNGEIRLLSRQLRRLARDDEDVRLNQFRIIFANPRYGHTKSFSNLFLSSLVASLL